MFFRKRDGNDYVLHGVHDPVPDVDNRHDGVVLK
jgi:hypothetical protein